MLTYSLKYNWEQKKVGFFITKANFLSRACISKYRLLILIQAQVDYYVHYYILEEIS